MPRSLRRPQQKVSFHAFCRLGGRFDRVRAALRQTAERCSTTPSSVAQSDVTPLEHGSSPPQCWRCQVPARPAPARRTPRSAGAASSGTRASRNRWARIATFSFVGQSFQIPTAYPGRGLPRPKLRPEDAVRLQAWAPNLSRHSRPSRPVPSGSRFPRACASLSSATLSSYAGRRGWTRWWRPTATRTGMTSATPSASPCSAHGRLGVRLGARSTSLPRDRTPYSTATSTAASGTRAAQRAAGSAARFRLEMDFDKPLIADYPALDAGLAGFMWCALGPAGTPGQVWPSPESASVEITPVVGLSRTSAPQYDGPGWFGAGRHALLRCSNRFGRGRANPGPPQLRRQPAGRRQPGPP